MHPRLTTWDLDAFDSVIRVEGKTQLMAAFRCIPYEGSTIIILTRKDGVTYFKFDKRHQYTMELWDRRVGKLVAKIKRTPAEVYR